MSLLLLTLDPDQRAEVLEMLKAVRGVVVVTQPAADGTMKIKTVTRSLDDESEAVHAVEDIPGVIDLRLL